MSPILLAALSRMGDWEPKKTQEVDGRTIYLWTVPARHPCQGDPAAGHLS